MKMLKNMSRRVKTAAAADADFIVTTGGVSVGGEDHLIDAFTAAGGEIGFAGVAIKPGKPVAVGRVGNALWLGLPGNPGAACVTWSVLGTVILNTLAGKADTHPSRRYVVLKDGFSRKPGRCEIRSARIVGADGQGRDIVECPSNVNSGQVVDLSLSDGLAFLPADAEYLPPGALIGFQPFCND